MQPAAQVVLFDAAAEPARALHEQLRRRGLQPEHRDLRAAAADPVWPVPGLAVLVLGTQAGADERARAAAVLARLTEARAATLVWGAAAPSGESTPLVQWLAPETSLDEIAGRLESLAGYVPLVARLEREMGHLHRLGEQLNRYFSEIDQEMRLAGRLQRDLLPRQMPELPGLRCAVLYRPATWVSGDTYDLFRVDERHAGAFIADAMGHGLAAGLQTMFFRQALVTKRIMGTAYEVLGPVQTLAELHESLTRQKLPNCQFVTAAYGLYDCVDRRLRVSRGGHPYPLVIRAGGGFELVRTLGSLLGLADVPFEANEACVDLAPGDKVLFYTDGLEEDLFAMKSRPDEPETPTAALREWAGLPAPELVTALQEHLDCKEGSLHPADDVTLLALEVVE